MKIKPSFPLISLINLFPILFSFVLPINIHFLNTFLVSFRYDNPIFFAVVSLAISFVIQDLPKDIIVLNLILYVILKWGCFSFESKKDVMIQSKQGRVNEFKNIIDELNSPIMMCNNHGNKILFQNRLAKDLDFYPHKFMTQQIKQIVLNKGITLEVFKENTKIYAVSIVTCLWNTEKGFFFQFKEFTPSLNELKAHINCCKILEDSCHKMMFDLEKDYRKWANLQGLNIIKEADLKPLSMCLINCYALLNHLFLQKATYEAITEELKHLPENLSIKNNIVYTIELLTRYYYDKIPEIDLRFEDSFPSSGYADPKIFQHVSCFSYSVHFHFLILLNRQDRSK